MSAPLSGDLVRFIQRVIVPVLLERFLREQQDRLSSVQGASDSAPLDRSA